LGGLRKKMIKNKRKKKKKNLKLSLRKKRKARVKVNSQLTLRNFQKKTF